jgi:hypothetical protein
MTCPKPQAVVPPRPRDPEPMSAMPSPRLVLALAATLVVGLGAAVLFRGAGEVPFAPLGPVGTAGDADGTPVERRGAGPGPGVVDEFAAEEGAERVAVDSPPGGDGPRLRVVAAGSGRPVPGATVRFAEVDRLGGGRERGGLGWIERLESDGVRLVADAAGEVALPPVRRRILVAAAAEGLFGFTSVDREATEAVVEIDRDETLRVRVVDLAGRPLEGVEVVLGVDLLRRLPERGAATTDADGLAELRHVQLMRMPMPAIEPATLAQAGELANRVAALEQVVRVQGGPGPGGTLRIELDTARGELRRIEGAVREGWRQRQRAEPGAAPAGPAQFADFVVTARIPQAAPAALRIPARAIPTREVELRVGGLGSLSLKLIGPDGAPLASPCRVELRRSRANPLPSTVEPALADGLGDLVAISRDKPLGESTLRFEPVGSGLLLEVSLRFADRDFAFDHGPFDGPAPGEDRLVEVLVPDWFTVLSGRLVDPGGKPWSGLQADLLLGGRAGRVEGESVRTDEDGRFELPLRLREPTPPYVLEIHAEAGDQPVGALVEVPRLDSGRRHELGDLVVAGLPVLASGTVRDDRGQPIAGADLQLQAFAPGVRDRSGAEVGAWQEVAYVRAASAEDGSFRLFGETRGEPVRVRARARGHTEAVSPTLAFGGTFDPTLLRVGTLVARGHLPDWLPRGAVQLELSQGGRVVRREELRARREGEFRAGVGGLAPGAYDLVCTLRGIGPVFARQGLQVEPGATREVAPIDLREVLFRYVVQAVDQAGEPIRDPGSPLLAQLADPNGGGLRWTAFPWRGDRVEFYAPDRSAAVVVLGNGRRPVRTQVAPGESKVRLTQLNPIEVELPGLRAMVGPRRVRVSLVFEGDTGLPMEDFQAIDQARGQERGYPRAALGKSSGAWLGEDDLVRMPLMLNGRYRVVARISQEGRRGNVSKDLGTVEAVVDAAEVQRVRLAPAPALVQQAIAELEAR